MADTRVPRTMPTLTRTGIEIGAPIRLPAWRAIGEAANHLLGRGGMLIPTAYIGQSIAKGTTSTFRVRLWPRYQATHRVWIFHLSVAGSAAIKITDPSSGVYPASGYATVGSGPIMHVETIGSRTASAVDTDFKIEANTGSVYAAPTLVSVTCYEVPRPDLATDANESGIDLSTLSAVSGIAPIYDDTGASVGGVREAVTAALDVTRRCGLYYVLRGDSSPFSFTTTSYVDPLAAPMPVLDRKKYRSESARLINVAAYGVTGATTTMDVRISSAGAGDSVTLSWSAGDTGSWKSGTFEVSVEDLTDAKGLQGAAVDLVTIEGKRTSGTNAAQLQSVCLGGT